jgi:hypothetical protein
MKPAVIFDIDGTLADLSDRLHYLDKGDWKSFFAEVKNDKPITPVIEMNHHMSKLYNIIVVSGRCSSTRKDTVDWLFNNGVYYDQLHMRTESDHRPDHIVKEELLREIQKDYEVRYVFDDRQSVVDMWRRNGITCFQCAPDKPMAKGKLTLMVGPSGAGKTTMLASMKSYQVVSSDDIREEICGDRRDQSQNDRVFRVLHELARTRIHAGLDVIVDATNIKRKDRMSLINLANGGPVEYNVVDRPLYDKLRDRGWRPEWLIMKHDQTFKSNLKDILNGDGMPNVFVKDLRK